MADLTPMMKQYLEIKEQNQDCILFFRLGDFYEMFEDDARLASKELDLTLTTRDRTKENPDDRVPMCGVPYHSSEAYIARLIAKGYKVAICEQMEDPALAKGLVSREVIRIVTPGTVIDSSMLDEGRNNFICSVCLDAESSGICFCDISTGEFFASGFDGPDRVSHLINELGRFAPAEAVLSEEAFAEPDLLTALNDKLGCRCESGGAGRFEPAAAEERILRQFGAEARGTIPREKEAVARSAGALLAYLYETQKTDLSHINVLSYYQSGQYMELDLTARRNLELTETMRSKEKRGSLLWVLDHTQTAMGGRLLRSWIEKPLLSPVAIRRRHLAVQELLNSAVPRAELILVLKKITDMERLVSRAVYGTANGRDLVALSLALSYVPDIKRLIAPFSSVALREIFSNLDELSDIRALIDRAIAEEPPFSVREGGVIRTGYDAEVDRLRDVMSGGKGSVAAIEASEREKSGIKNLKIGYNKVFGYYIEVSKSNYALVPQDYIRKQTLANCERYITPELKEMESTILTAHDKVVALEYELFTGVREAVAGAVHRIQKTASAVARLDTLASFAEAAGKNGYVMPEVDDSGLLEIREGRHPVVEKVLKGSLFVPNDTRMGTEEERVAIITGPNMAGKSTYMRQVALIALMAQIGSFVPAKSARLGVVDRIFTRVGASDDLAAGQSTFMVEMTEVADILRHATAKSLLILDEIGRGTSTFDGMSIARAVLEYCADKKRLGAKTLFATHFHELTEMEEQLAGVKNFNIAVKKRGDEIIFLRKIVRGGADKSYGVEVAKLAGIPDRVIDRAKEILLALENGGPVKARGKSAPAASGDQLSMLDMGASRVADRLRELDVNTLTPIEAMNLLFELKQSLN
ncbi:DNA mismatch repair protein MutS [Papillibacter cinnamivorans DSM 12816]|uniref:DNA mismatch repair protein MutS n=1 Tax=Papillibacter cinnamivorans DSM 12816 TaxID=1122930 RepID=A0A1W2A5S8_9FIRM|nr:DNA mismatch repair protein MutS [Papillibacter cinnamivorans]SMC55996.1 DNA mismatch repair protein MutS [Papillibacter cinnamivorans DSM 12816]